MRTIKIALFALIVNALFTSLAIASGAYGGGFGGRSGSFESSARPAKQIDQNYETGKAIYSGRQNGSPKLEYCLDVEGERLPLRRSSVKNFKRTSYDELNEKLFLCDDPEKRVQEALTRDELLYVLYYLNKRYRLHLG